MREMKDSGVEWIGEIPKEWQVKPTKNLFKIVSGATPKSEIPEYWDGDIAWITPADYKTSDKYIAQGRKSITQQGYTACSTMLIPVNSLVFSKRAPIGAVAINNAVLCTNQGCLSCVVLSPDETNVEYYYYLMSVATEQYELYGSGTTFKEISSSNFASFCLLYPSIFEQKEIVSVLRLGCAQVDTLISNVQTQIEKLKQYKQSLITEVVTKGLDPTVPMKYSGVEWIGEIPAHWLVLAIKYLCSMQSGKTLTSEQIANEGEYPVYGGNGLRGYFSDYNTNGKFLLIGRQGALCGNVHKVEGRFWATEHAVVTKQYDTVCLDYLFYLLTGMNLNQYVSPTAAQPGLAVSTIQNTITCLPPYVEQLRAVDFLKLKCSQIDRLISIKQSKIEKLNAYKKSLIYEYVTGKKEVVCDG